jgi:CheY-like chemotaxis protein
MSTEKIAEITRRHIPDQPAATEVLPDHYRDSHVLVVEDEPLNREIVEALLASVGIYPHMAENGQEALDILLQAGPGTFDLVLMDIQMPFMDGFAATRALRSQTGFASIPVIGVTALTLEYHKKIGTEAGLSDHIGKPYDSATFYRMLAKWIPKDKHKTARAPEEAFLQPESMTAAGNALRTLRGVDTQAAIARLDGKEDRYLYWLADFVANTGKTPDKIRGDIVAGFPNMAAKRVQALKARVGMLGMTEIHDLVVALDLALRHGTASDELLDTVEKSIQEMSNQVARVLGQESTT